MKKLSLDDKFPVGKYIGRPVIDIVMFDPNYLIWLHKNGVEFDPGGFQYIKEKAAAGPDPHYLKMERRRIKRESKLSSL